MSNVESHLPSQTLLAGGIALPLATSPAARLDAPPKAAITIFPLDQSESVVIPFSAHTHDGFREWALSDDFPERGKITFVEGELVVDMSPESIEVHSAIKTEISRVLATIVRQQKSGQFHIDGVLITNADAKVSNEPDALFVSRETLKSGRVTLTPAVGHPDGSKEMVGTVDWVLEIVSPSSRRKDKKLLRDAYYKAGIAEYWLVDALGEEIEFQLLVPGDGGYVAAQATDGWLPSPTFGRSFKLTRERDEDGYWLYTLEHKEN
jgi:Uma2 family endonuclease